MRTADELTSVLGDNAIANGLVSAVESLPDDAAALKEAATKLADFDGIVGGAQDAVEGAIDGAQDAVEGVVEGAQDAVEGAVEGVKDAANDAVEGVKDAANDVKDAAAAKVDEAKDASPASTSTSTVKYLSKREPWSPTSVPCSTTPASPPSLKYSISPTSPRSMATPSRVPPFL